MRRPYLIGALILLLLAVSLILIVNRLSLAEEPLGREHYAAIDIENPEHLPSATFQKEYAEAVESGAQWIQQPTEVGLRLAGYPTVDGNKPNKITVYQSQTNEVTVVVLTTDLRDDSIKDQEVQIALVESDGIWEVEWAGYRQRCHRSLHKGWVTTLCP